MTNNEIFNEIRENCYMDDNVSNDRIMANIMEDYYNLIELRNRIATGTDEDTEIFDEDHLVCDHILDYMEYFIKMLKEKDRLQDNINACVNVLKLKGFDDTYNDIEEKLIDYLEELKGE